MVSPAQSRLIDAELAPAALGSQISGAIASKALNAQKQEGAAVLKLLDSAASTQALTADPNGVGGNLDITA